MATFNSPLEAFMHWENETPNRIFIRQPINGKTITYTFKEAKAEVCKVASKLKLKSPQYISNLERGICAPSMEAIEQFCQIYKISKKEIVELMVDDYRSRIQEKLNVSLKKKACK